METDVVRLSEELVSVDTAPGASTDPLAALVADRLKGLGARVVLQSGQADGARQANLIVRLGGPGPAGLVLAGHLDTVPWAAGTRATTRPERDGRTLYARGACDMKGPIAAQLVASARRARALRRPLVLAYTFAEETGCEGALRLLEGRGDAGPLAGAACIVGEPTGLVPVLAHKGYAVARITIEGRPAHSSDPWAGADASAALGRLLVALHALREELRAAGDPACGLVPPCTTLNTGVVAAGAAPNVVPAHATVELEWRPIPGFDGEALRLRVERLARAACDGVPGTRCRLEWPPPMPAFRQEAGHPLVAWAAARTGQAPGTVPFYTEAELYRGGLEVDTIVCGPGSIAKAHREDESILFDELEAGADFYDDAIVEFCG